MSALPVTFGMETMQKLGKWKLISLVLSSLVVYQASPQNPGDSVANQPQSPVGIWELAEQNGGAIGINLWEVPASLGHGGPPLKSDEKDYPVLQIGVYERVKAKVRCGEENFFDAGWRGPTFGTTTSYQHQSLTIHSPGSKGDWPIDVQLTFDAQQDVWKGRFHRGPFDEKVTLIRVQDHTSHDGDLCFGSQETNFPSRSSDRTNR
jgi:hypothetical protein